MPDPHLDNPSLITRLLDRWSRLLLCIYWPALIFVTHRTPTNTHNFEIRDVPPDKILHVACFAILTGLLTFARPLTRKFPLSTNAVAAAIIAAAYAYLDEYTQLWFSRHVSPLDVAANLTGIITVLFAALWSFASRQSRTCTLARVFIIIYFPLVILALFDHEFSLRLIRLFTHDPATIILNRGFTRPDRIGHILLAFFAFIILLAARPLGRKRYWTNFITIAVILAASAPIIEKIQTRFGRTNEQLDIDAHMYGLAIAVTLALFFHFSTQIKKRFFKKHPAPDTDQPKPEKSFISHALTVSSLTLISRLLGLLRDTTFAYAFGLSSVTNAFYFGFMIPNLFRRLFGEGALTAAFIPVYTDLKQNNPAAAKRLASASLAILTITLSLITIAGELLLAYLGTHHWSQETSLAIALTRIMLPYMPMICLVALIGGILHVHKKFAVPALMPIVLNLCLIASALFATHGVWNDQPLQKVIPIVALGVLLAGIIQLTWQLTALLHVQSLTTNFTGTKRALKNIALTMIPMLLGLAVIQINTFFDGFIAFAFAPKLGSPQSLDILGWSFKYPLEAHSITAINWSQRLYQFPLGVFGIAVATAIFPALAAAATPTDDNFNLENFRKILRQGLQLTLFIALPASVGLIIVRLPLTRLIFEYGQTDLLQTVQVSTILVGYASGVWAYSMIHILTRAFYALKDAKTPLIISIVMVIINLALNLTLIWPLGAAGLAWSTAFCAMLQTAILILAIRKYVDQLIDIPVLKSWGTTFCLTTLMACALEPLVSYFNPPTLTRTQSATLLFTLVALGITIYTLGAWKFNAPELRWLLKRKTDQ